MLANIKKKDTKFNKMVVRSFKKTSKLIGSWSRNNTKQVRIKVVWAQLTLTNLKETRKKYK